MTQLPLKTRLSTVTIAAALLMISAANATDRARSAREERLASLPMMRASVEPTGDVQTAARIARLGDHWTILNKQDPKAIAQIYAQDGSLYVPGAPPVTGHAAILATWQAALRTPGFHIDRHTTKLTLSKSGDMAIDTGTYVLKSGSKARVVENGKFVVTWIRRRGTWQMLTDSLSPGGATPAAETVASR